jgi:hypothetical protein
MKIEILKSIIHYAFISSLKRWKRLSYHIFQLLPGVKPAIRRTQWYDWPVDLVYYLVDILYLPEWYCLVVVLFKGNIRLANDLEKYLIAEYFQGLVDERYVLFNDKASFLVKKFAHALVTFNMIHFDKELSEPIIVHELVHVHQYQKYGSVYLYRALQAQLSKNTYDYGGPGNLASGAMKGKTINDYNFEQQASIVEDFYRLNNQFTLFYSHTESEILEKHYKDLFV